MKNPNYTSEIATAAKFIEDHSYDGDLRTFLYDMMHNTDEWTHSDRWSTIYNWMKGHYPEATGSLITGLTYYCES